MTISSKDITLKATTGGILTQADKTPNQFTFIDQGSVAVSSVITSAAINITGVDFFAICAVTVTGGTYSINGSAFTSAPGTAGLGDSIAVRHTSSGNPFTPVDTILTIEGISDTFTSTTAGAGFGQILMSVATADVPYNSLVYGRPVAINDVLNYATTAPKDDLINPESGAVLVDTLGVPTITGSYGTYEVTFDFDGGASEVQIRSHYDEAAIEALFTQPAQDANGRTIIPTPESTARLIYVDPTLGNNATAGPAGNGTDTYTTATLPGGTFQNPTGITAYEDWDTAWALWRDGEGDYLLLKRGETFTVTAAMGSKALQAGKSHTFPHVICDYGTGALPIARLHPDVGPSGRMFTTSTGDNFNYIFNIDFHAQYRDPDHTDFVGYGLTEFSIDVLDFGPGFNSGQTIDGVLIEGCIFRYTGPKFGGGSGDDELVRAIVRRCAFYKHYSEAEQVSGLFASNISILQEENVFYHNGWLVPDDGTFATQNGSGTHSGGDSTTFSGTISNFNINMDGAVVRINGTSGEYARVDTISSNTLTATYGADNGGGPVTFTAGDSISVRGQRMRGQGNGENHNSYTSKAKNSIFRRNLNMEGSGAGMKLTGFPSNRSDNEIDGTHTGSGPEDTTFVNATSVFGATDVLVGAPIIRLAHGGSGADRYGIVQSNTGTTLTAFFTLTDEDELFGTSTGTVLMGFGNGDDIRVLDPPPFPELAPDVIIYDNYFAGNTTSLSADTNFEDRDWVTRFHRLRFMNNTITKGGYLDITGSAASYGVWARWWEDSCVGNNVITKMPISSTFGATFAKTNINNRVTRNVFFDIGITTGSDVQGQGPLTINSGFYEHDSYQVLANQIQMKNTDATCIGDWDSDASASSEWADNAYYSSRSANTWWEVDDVVKTKAEWDTETGETGATITLLTYTAEQTHELYMAGIGEVTTTIENLANLAIADIEAGVLNNDHQAQYIVKDFQLNYTEV